MAGIESELIEDMEDSKQSDEDVNNEETDKDVNFISRLSWYFQPIFPVYEVIKASNGYASRIFGILETTISRFLSVLEGENSSIRNGVGNHVSQDPVTSSLFKIWFQAHKNLRHSMNYIEGLYEEIVPPIPGRDPPFSGMDVQSMTIRAMCFYGTLHMICRLPYHTTKFFSKMFDRIKMFILEPTERIVWHS